MVTFPYPYMNGRLHLGHAFSLTKAEFTARFQRMLGKNVLFPFGFHCTGMPIQAAANKLREEIAEFGNPPVFPDDDSEMPVSVEDVNLSDNQPTTEAGQNAEDKVEKKGKGKKTKLIVKGQVGSGGKKIRQWDILSKMVKPEEIASFQDPLTWLTYFPPLGIEDLKTFGCAIDWRRSFITTSINRFYNAFIEWQFRLLKEGGRIKSGYRPSIYSVKDQQVCADHDRSSGEGVVPQEYTIVKLRIRDISKHAAIVNLKNIPDNNKIYLAAATLRPETMYGQTNCFLLPEGSTSFFLSFFPLFTLLFLTSFV
jgi:leucyl-tRNA synthetase